MALCVQCGFLHDDATELCPHHHCVYGPDWATANRIQCDFFHRGVVPPRLSTDERDDAIDEVSAYP
jgi:hypothetical protein